MTIADELLPLEASPRAVSDARRWVAAACRRLQRDDLVEAAVMGTSELVTNALLHAEPPFWIQLRGTAEHPRVEVHDGSNRPLVPPREYTFDPLAIVDLDEDLADVDMEPLLTTFGRGLSLVSMASVAWGSSVEAGSKVVWFEPASVINEHGGPDPVLDQATPDRVRTVPEDAITVRWYGIDPLAFAAQRRQYFGVRRELRLLALAHGDEYPLATEMGTVFGDFERHFPAESFTQFADLAAPDSPLINVSLEMDPGAGEICTRMLRLFDLADDFCRQQLLLSMARTALVREFQTWFLGEAVQQLQGRTPHPWVAPNSAHAG